MKSPIIVIGNPRSGTTLLRLMLTCHKNICIPPECGWLIGLYPKYHNVSFNKNEIDNLIHDIQLPNVRKIETWNLDFDDLRLYLYNYIKYFGDSYSDIIGAIYKYYLSSNQPSKIRWGDKNNFFLNHINEINKLFPNALFIHIVRDGRDVACSYQDLVSCKTKYAPKLPTIVGDIAHKWVQNLSTIENSLNKINYKQSIIIKYEDLVINTEDILKNICSFIDEPYDSNMLNFYNINRAEKLEPDETIEWKSLTKKPITNTRIGRWKDRFTENEKETFNFIANQKLIRYGYKNE